eukprot:COSAG02_NODE_1970_length_10224_cov_104.344691_2_plen_65_part_00
MLVVRVFVCPGDTVHRRMRLGPKQKMGEKNSRTLAESNFQMSRPVALPDLSARYAAHALCELSR